jgi:hypothetical protein
MLGVGQKCVHAALGCFARGLSEAAGAKNLRQETKLSFLHCVSRLKVAL